MSDNLKGILAMLASAMGFVANDATVKFITQELPNGQIIFLRGLVATALMGLVTSIVGGWRSPVVLLKPAMMIRLAAAAVATLFVVAALRYLPLATTNAIIQVSPLLVTAAMVEAMKPGSVVVDLAAETGGNVEGSVPGEVVRIGGAQVWGGRNVPAQMPGPASRLYAQNIVNLLTLMTTPGADGGAAAFTPDFADEIVAGSCVVHEGRILHEPTRAALEGGPA